MIDFFITPGMNGNSLTEYLVTNVEIKIMGDERHPLGSSVRAPECQL